MDEDVHQPGYAIDRNELVYDHQGCDMAVADRPTACVADLHRSHIRVARGAATVLMSCGFGAIGPARHIALSRARRRCWSWHGRQRSYGASMQRSSYCSEDRPVPVTPARQAWSPRTPFIYATALIALAIWRAFTNERSHSDPRHDLWVRAAGLTTRHCQADRGPVNARKTARRVIG
jgi:hypothetical protein